MKKIVLLALPVLALLMGNIQASYPDNLSNILPEDIGLINKECSQDEIAQEQAARLILWASAKDLKKSSYKYGWRVLKIIDEERKKLQFMLGEISTRNKKELIQGLTDGTISLLRSGNDYSVFLNGKENNIATFSLGFTQNLNGQAVAGILKFFEDYILRPTSSLQIVREMCGTEILPISHRHIIYVACLERADLDAERIDFIIAQAHAMQHSLGKTEIYSKYLSLENVEQNHVNEIFEQISENINNCANVYAAYLGREDADQDKIALILQKIGQWEASDRSVVEAAYMRRADADVEIVKLIMQAAAEYNGRSKTEIFAAYAARMDTDIKDVLLNIDKEFEEYETQPNLFRSFEYLANLYAAYISREDADLDTVKNLLEKCKKINNFYLLEVYRAYLDNSNIFDEDVLREVFLELEKLPTGPWIIQKYNNRKRFKKSKSARSVVEPDASESKRPRLEFDSDEGDGNEADPKKAKKD